MQFRFRWTDMINVVYLQCPLYLDSISKSICRKFSCVKLLELVYTSFMQSSITYEKIVWKTCFQLISKQEWQFPNSFAALNGCHVPIECPAGGPQTQKEHHNFKSFYPVVLMALVDVKYRFILASSGWTTNTHDSTILLETGFL